MGHYVGHDAEAHHVSVTDRLLIALEEQGDAADYQRLAAEVLGIRGAPPALARTLVEQALHMTDRREHWRQVGARAIEAAPDAPGVYVFRDQRQRALYVGKALSLRRRLRAHFAAPRWRALPPALAGIASVECEQAGSELAALLREAALIRELRPAVNVHKASPSLETRAIARSLVRDVIVLLPSVDAERIEIVAARADGATQIHGVSRTDGDMHAVANRLRLFFTAPASAVAAVLAASPDAALAPLVFSWLARRGQRATRLDPHACGSSEDLQMQLERLCTDRDLFVERVILS